MAEAALDSDKLVLQKKLHGTVTMLFYCQEWHFDLYLKK